MSSSATVHHDEFKDSVPPPQIRQEIRAATEPEGDRIDGIYGGETIHTGNISKSDPGQQQLFRDVPPAGQQGLDPLRDESKNEQRKGGVLPSYPVHHDLTRPEDDTEFLKHVQEIGGKPGEVKDIGMRPITPADARTIQQLETEALHPTGKGSFAARAQSAAAANVRDRVVPPDAGPCATAK